VRLWALALVFDRDVFVPAWIVFGGGLLHPCVDLLAGQARDAGRPIVYSGAASTGEIIRLVEISLTCVHARLVRVIGA